MRSALPINNLKLQSSVWNLGGQINSGQTNQLLRQSCKVQIMQSSKKNLLHESKPTKGTIKGTAK